MKKIQIYLVFILTLLVSTNAQQFVPTNCSQLSFLPQPHSISCNLKNLEPLFFQNPCSILYRIKGSTQQSSYSHFVQLIEHQQLKTFGCRLSHIAIGKIQSYQASGFKYQVHIQIVNHELKSAFKTKEQSYYIKIENKKTFIKAPTYVGFVRGLETFMQSITCDKWKITNCHMKYLPIQIEDEPDFLVRSIMIDTSRHYLPVSYIYETIDALMYNKMNFMHWHIVDEDSFPLKLDSHPQIAQYAAFSPEQIYTTKQVKSIVKYALVRGVRIVPELDTPGHAASWGRAPQNQGLACNFTSSYMGPLDVTLDATYKLVKQVFTQIFTIFPDPWVHLGGDEVVLTCLANRTQFQKAHGKQIQLAYRKIQRKMLKQVNQTKRFVYWMNSQIKLEGDDIVHWWGSGLPDTKHDVIISNYGPFYLDMGVGNYFANSYGSYNTWLDMYKQDIGQMAKSHSHKDRILGGEATLWSQVSNKHTHHQKIWIRSSSLAERTWIKSNQTPAPDFLRRITAHERLMNRRGIPTAAATCQVCEFNPEYCS